MKASIIASIAVAATGINAAPAELAPRLTSIPLSIYDSPGCNNGPASSIANIPTDGSCFPTTAILTANTNSVLINTENLAALPAGCTVTLYDNFSCDSQNHITVTSAGQCFTFGANRFVSSAKTSGTC
ncbi:uncharacterized protein EI97DRAFT_459060 [Westerdykella ornata]|uniref:Uncharacterized protein n=1 Tax=Westerdykella ornata TaxID=318751 RepID=A0A6A6JIV3_WESOR|nr:uncharacterized protein EI97DRAFT_459060 [Westerdykella ornata]KAF2275586.1 hypothetical protein EI97DRAFT_459060 [Westerdykella ornata]